MVRTALLLSVAFAVILVLTPPSPAADSDTLSIPLKSFKMKPKSSEAPSDLLGFNEDEGKLFYYTHGTGEAVVKVSADGEFEITIKASCDPAQNERAKFKLTIDGNAVGQETLLTADDAKDYKLTGKLKSGDRKLSIEFTNDIYKDGEYDRNFYVHAVTLKKLK